MNLTIVAIHDRATDAYSTPIFVHTTGQAIRGFQDEINEPNNPMSKHPDDYDLYQLGEYDNATGAFTNLKEPRQLAIGKQLKTGA